jgi:hypothetical protein
MKNSYQKDDTMATENMPCSVLMAFSMLSALKRDSFGPPASWPQHLLHLLHKWFTRENSFGPPTSWPQHLLQLLYEWFTRENSFGQVWRPSRGI